MTATRATQTHGLLDAVFGGLDDLPSCVGDCDQGNKPCKHVELCSGRIAPSARRIEVPLKPERVQVDDRIADWRKRAGLPELPVLPDQIRRPLPASCDEISTMGERVMVAIGKLTLAGFAIVGIVHVAARLFGGA